MATERAQQIAAFLMAAGWGTAERQPVAGDASFRRYERVVRGGESAILMDAPPPREDVGAFDAVAKLLLRLGLSAPRPYAVDRALGLMLLEDLGDCTFTRALAEGSDEAALYMLAVDVLIALHRRWPDASDAATWLPPYDEERLIGEAALLVDWYLPAMRSQPTPARERAAFIEAWRQVLPRVRATPETLVLRDYHVDNLMQLEDREGVTACGLLDFQDAVVGSVAYDLVSLLEDARRDVPTAIREAMLERYLAAFPQLHREPFLTAYAVLGAQRNTKIIGIFTRLDRRDGKPQYLQHIPRVWRLLEGELSHPLLASVKAWFDQTVPQRERAAPRAGAAA